MFPCTGLLGLLLNPKTRIMNQNKRCFTPKLPDCCPNLLVLPCGRMLPRWWVVGRVVTGTLMYSWALCPRCPETPPPPYPRFWRCEQSRDLKQSQGPCGRHFVPGGWPPTTRNTLRHALSCRRLTRRNGTRAPKGPSALTGPGTLQRAVRARPTLRVCTCAVRVSPTPGRCLTDRCGFHNP